MKGLIVIIDPKTEAIQRKPCPDLYKHAGSSLVQVRNNLYSYNQTYSQWLCWSDLEKNPINITFKAMSKTHRNAPLANYKNQFIFALGGTKANAPSKALYSVEMYSVRGDYWIDGPVLHYKRIGHSCCALGDKVYVFSGKGFKDCMESIESLDVPAYLANPEQVRWKVKIIEIATEDFRGRLGAVFCPISSNEILIMGGTTDKGKVMKNTWIYKTEIRRIKKVPWAKPSDRQETNVTSITSSASCQMGEGKVAFLGYVNSASMIGVYRQGAEFFDYLGSKK